MDNVITFCCCGFITRQARPGALPQARAIFRPPQSDGSTGFGQSASSNMARRRSATSSPSSVVACVVALLKKQSRVLAAASNCALVPCRGSGAASATRSPACAARMPGLELAKRGS